MTQEKLQRLVKDSVVHATIHHSADMATNHIMRIINQHITEVIGEDEDHIKTDKYLEYVSESWARDKLRAEQRKRAGL